MIPPKGWLAIDIETDGDPWNGRLICVGVSDPLEPEVFTSVFFDGHEYDWLRGVLADPGVGIVEHTLYDARWLRLHGWEINGPVADTRVMAWNVDENQKLDLESLVFRYLHKSMDKRLTQRKGQVHFRCDDGSVVPIGEAPTDQMSRYNTDDVRKEAELFNFLLPLQPQGWSEQLDLTDVLLDMECTGVPMDMETLEWTRESFTETREQIRAELLKDLPSAFNLNSGDQVAALLFLKEFDLPGRVRRDEPRPEGFVVEKEGRVWDRGHYVVEGFGLRPGKWTESESRPSTDSKTLAVKYGSHPWVAQFLEYQALNKLVGTYLEALPRYVHDGRLYGTFNQAGTVSGRLSSSSPNLQNQPARGKYGMLMRRLFKGDLLIADFSQLEPRLMAHWSQDPQLLSVFKHKDDIYKQTAALTFGVAYHEVTAEQRFVAKTLVLAMGYGAQARKVAEILSVAGRPTTAKEAGGFLRALREAYPVFFDWREKVIADARATGYVHTLAGRKRHIGFEGVDTAWKAERQAVNSVIQGSAADVVNETMLRVARLDGLRLLIQVHDELVCEYERGADLDALCASVQEAGESFDLSVPLIFEPKVCEDWSQK